MAPKKTVSLYDYARISTETGIPATKLRVWFQRGKLPEPDYRLGQSPGWLAETIRPWIKEQRAATPEAGTSTV